MWDWALGAAGGLMIGGAGALYLLMNGRVMGASGILGGLVDGSGLATAAERLAFLTGLVGIPTLVLAFADAPDTQLTDSWLIILSAGLLVGVGTRLANGCTSGHGVCGISRLSVRGIVATLIYMGAGAGVIVLARHVLGVI